MWVSKGEEMGGCQETRKKTFCGERDTGENEVTPGKIPICSNRILCLKESLHYSEDTFATKIFENKHTMNAHENQYTLVSP